MAVQNFVISLFLALFSMQAMAESWKVQMLRSPTEGTKFIGIQKSTVPVPRGLQVRLRSLPRFLPEGAPASKVIFQEYLVNDAEVPAELRRVGEIRSKVRPPTIPGSEVKVLIQQGPKENRINLTIVGDGYTPGEKEKFFADALRTTKELFASQTFASYLPLFNVYAVFVPSNESGIGDGSPKNTALKLYREPRGSKRGIMPGDPAAADRAIAQAPATDYPILLANDNYYGGLGGEYAISTSSPRSGMVVLRHELGHNFGNVGEEYDGGYVYSGANSSRSANPHWAYWADGGVAVHEALFLGGEYMWKNLAKGPIVMNFEFPKLGNSGSYSGLMSMSTVGWATREDVSVDLDGSPLPLKGSFHDDRNFYELGPSPNFPPGNHTVTFKEMVKDGDNVLAYVRLYAYPKDYDYSFGKVGAFLNYDVDGNRVGYRPTHNSCLMRNMQLPNFCPVDRENMWFRFLDRVSLIDDVVVGNGQQQRPQQRVQTQGQRVVTLKAPKLNGFSIAWYKIEGGNEKELGQLRDIPSWKVPAGLTGRFKVKVKFVTPEVRKYNKRFFGEKSFNL